MTVASRLRLWLVAGLALASCCAGCPKPPPPPAARIVPPAEMALNLHEALPVKSAQYAVKLDYDVNSPQGDSAMELINPKQPQGTEVQLDLCTIKAQPYIFQPKIAKSGLRQCRVDCAYTLCVHDPQGMHVGDFEIVDWGTLILKSRTVSPDLTYTLLSTSDRALYLFYRKQPSGIRHERLFAIEYTPNKAMTRRELQAPDGWHYTFWSPDGRVIVHDPQDLGELEEQLTLQAAAENEAREKDNAAWRKDYAKDQAACRTGGG